MPFFLLREVVRVDFLELDSSPIPNSFSVLPVAPVVLSVAPPAVSVGSAAFVVFERLRDLELLRSVFFVSDAVGVSVEPVEVPAEVPLLESVPREPVGFKSVELDGGEVEVDVDPADVVEPGDDVELDDEVDGAEVEAAASGELAPSAGFAASAAAASSFAFFELEERLLEVLVRDLLLEVFFSGSILFCICDASNGAVVDDGVADGVRSPDAGVPEPLAVPEVEEPVALAGDVALPVVLAASANGSDEPAAQAGLGQMEPAKKVKDNDTARIRR